MPMKSRTTIRWTDQEHRTVRRCAEGRGITISELIREVLLTYLNRRPSLL